MFSTNKSHPWPMGLLSACLIMGVTINAAHAGPPVQAGQPSQGYYLITQQERLFLQNWFSRNLPPGLVKQQKIPPGVANQLQRGGQWPPPGIEYYPLPRELTQQLSPLPPDYEYFLAGSAVVIADLSAMVISDVVYDVLTR